MVATLITIAVTLGIYVAKEIISAKKLISIENKKLENEKEKNRHQQKLNEKSMYISAYFERYSEMYTEMQNIVASVNMFIPWENTLNEAFVEVEKSQKYSTQLIEDYNRKSNGLIRYKLNLNHFSNQLIEDLFNLKRLFHNNKILLDEEEKELIFNIADETGKICQLIHSLDLKNREVDNEKDLKVMYENFFNDNSEKIEISLNKISQDIEYIEKLFKYKFVEIN